MPVEEGWVYGQKPKEPEAMTMMLFGFGAIAHAKRDLAVQAPPDLESLFEAAGVPLLAPCNDAPLIAFLVALDCRYQISSRMGNLLTLRSGMQGPKRGQQPLRASGFPWRRVEVSMCREMCL